MNMHQEYFKAEAHLENHNETLYWLQSRVAAYMNLALEREINELNQGVNLPTCVVLGVTCSMKCKV